MNMMNPEVNRCGEGGGNLSINFNTAKDTIQKTPNTYHHNLSPNNSSKAIRISTKKRNSDQWIVNPKFNPLPGTETRERRLRPQRASPIHNHGRHPHWLLDIEQVCRFFISFFLVLAALRCYSLCECQSVSEMMSSRADQAASRFLTSNSDFSNSPLKHLPISHIKYRKNVDDISPSLKQFNNLNEDLMFEDSVDVRSHYHSETNDYGNDDERANIATASVVAANESSMIKVDSSLLPSVVNGHSKNEVNFQPESEQMRRFDLHSSPHLAPPSSVNVLSNQFTPDVISDLAPQDHHFKHSSASLLEIAPKRTDLLRIDVQRNKDHHHHQHQLQHQHHNRHSLPDRNNINRTTFEEHRHSITGNHILRPFFRKQRKQQNQLPVQQSIQSKMYRDNKEDFTSAWLPPMIELKRLNDNRATRANPSGGMFNKRLPLLHHDEEFVLTRSNSSLPDSNEKMMPVNAERRFDREVSRSSRNSNDEFQRRFGDTTASRDEPRNKMAVVPNERNLPSKDALRYLIDDISINDLELDDIGQGGTPNSGIGTGHRTADKPSQSNKASINAPQTFENPNSLHQNNNNNNLIGGSSLPAGQPPLSQIMPLFFDKFLSEFGNANSPLSHDGFSLPPKQAKFSFEPPIPNQSLPPTPLQPLNPLDADLSDLDAPMDRRLVPGTANILHSMKPEVGPPLFSNEVTSTNGFSDSDFGTWPKIFRFTDGRINLHDFEREKKRSRIKFSQKASKSQALYNIKRDSFLILHGGTFSK